MSRIATLSRVCSLAVVATCPSLIASSAYAVDVNSANLTIITSDASHAYVVGASCSVVNSATGVRQDGRSNKSGTATFAFLAPGKYTVLIHKDGFANISLDNVVLNVGDNKNLEVALQIGSAADTVSVNASEATINTTDGSVSTVIDHQFVENIPLNGRSFQSLETLVPGVVVVPSSGVGASGEISVNGQRTESNQFTVDGVSAMTGVAAGSLIGGSGYSGSTPSQTALGTTQSIVSVDALQEFRASTSTYSAEYGRSPGGQFSFATRAGTNDFHGSVFDYFRNEALDASNWFNGYINRPALRKPPERQNDFGGTFGGPVWIPRLYDGKNKTFFFFSYEGLRLALPQTVSNAAVPSLSLRQTAPAALQPLLNSFPLPTGANQTAPCTAGATSAYPCPTGAAVGTPIPNGIALLSASYSAPSSVNSTSIRIDHNVSERVKIFGRYSDAPSSSGSRYIPNLAQLNSTLGRTRFVTVGGTTSASTKFSNDLRFNYTFNHAATSQSLDSFGGAVPLDVSSLPGANGGMFAAAGQLFVGLAYGGTAIVNTNNSSASQHSLNVVNTSHLFHGNHNLAFGIDFRRISTAASIIPIAEQVLFSNLGSVLQNSGTATVSSQSQVPLEPIYKNLSLFVQDEWKSTPRLSLSFGMRWEVNPSPGDAYGNLPYTLNQIENLQTAKLAPKGTPLWKTTWVNFAPRTGFAYQFHPGSPRETVLRSGFGLFYDTGNTLGSNGLANGIGYSTRVSTANLAFPLTSAQLTLPPASIAPPYSTTIQAFDPNLKLPYTMQWNVAVEQRLTPSQTLKVGYVGSAGRRLLTGLQYRPSTLGNTNFSSSGYVNIYKATATSDYDAFQVTYQRALASGLQVLASYTWSHTIDEATNTFNTSQLLRGTSDYDIRNNFQSAITYELPSVRSRVGSLLFNNWLMDSRITARSALPFDVTAGSFVDATGTLQTVRANLVQGQPLYVYGSRYPGGRIVNYAAFSTPQSGQFGNAPRNYVRGFAPWQIDYGIRRNIPITEKVKLQFRAEAFNLLNHPQFGLITTTLSSGASTFGYATNTLSAQLGGLNTLYQTGGPRSLQLALKVQF